jgi:hypothetical protein
LYQDKFRFYASNAVDPAVVEGFQKRIQALLTEDPQMLYLQQVEQNAANVNSTDSQLGLLTMVNDYNARLAWKFESPAQTPETIVVTTMVELAL